MKLVMLIGCLAFLPLVAPAQDGLELQDKYFDSDGVKIRYVDVGSGDPVILLHGNGGSLETWVRSGALQDLSRDFRVIAFDTRGHGKSDKPHDPASYGREMSLDVLRLMDHIGAQKAHLIGYSMGAQTVAHLLVIAPNRVASAVLGGAPGRFYWTDEDTRQADRNAVERVRDCISRSMIAARAPTDAPPMSDEEFKRRSDACFADKSFDRFALAAVGRAQITQTMTVEQACAVTVPTLGVVGSLDGYVPLFEQLMACRPDMELRIIEGASHGSAGRNPEFLEASRAFLMAHRSAPQK